jgi:hypothetical protein
MLRWGEVHISSTYLFLQSVGVGVTPFISAGGGMSTYPFTNIDGQIYYAWMKVGVEPTEHLAIAAGGFTLRSPVALSSWSPDGWTLAGLVYGVATVGTVDYSMTAGIAYAYDQEAVADRPVIFMGCQIRISRTAALITENWFRPESIPPLVSLGVRFFKEKFAVDWALYNVAGEDAVVPGIPYVGMVWHL